MQIHSYLDLLKGLSSTDFLLGNLDVAYWYTRIAEGGDREVSLIEEPEEALNQELDIQILTTHAGEDLELLLSDKQERKRAADALRIHGSFHLNRSATCASVAREFYSHVKPQNELTVPVSELLEHLRTRMMRYIDNIIFDVVGIESVMHLEGRRDLLPKGATLKEKHADYVENRDKIISTHNWLRARAKDHPDFLIEDAAPQGPRMLSEALSIRPDEHEVLYVGMPPNISSDAAEGGGLVSPGPPGSEGREHRRIASLGDLPPLDVISCDWLLAKNIPNVDVISLRTRRAEKGARKAQDGSCGIDKQGRAWRRDPDNKQKILYFVPSLPPSNQK